MATPESLRRPAALALAWVALMGFAAIAVGDDPQAAYQRARAAFVAGDIETAASGYADLAARYPDNADYLLGHGQTLLASGRLRESIEVLERALELAPDYAGVSLVLGNARRALAATHDARVRGGLDSTRQEPPGAGRTTLTYGVESTLTERDDTWREVVAGAEYAWTRRALLGARASRSERFDRKDTLFQVYGSLPLSERVVIAGRGYYSPTQRVRLHYGGIVEAAVVLGRGFVLNGGGGRLQFENGPSDLLTTTLEYYFSAFRLAYTATVVEPAGGPWSPAHRWSASWYYGEDSRLNLIGGFGEETDESVLGAPLLRFDTWGGGFHGRHWLTPAFGLDYVAVYNGLETNRGDHLDRTTYYAGIVFRF